MTGGTRADRKDGGKREGKGAWHRIFIFILTFQCAPGGVASDTSDPRVCVILAGQRAVNRTRVGLFEGGVRLAAICAVNPTRVVPQSRPMSS